MLVGLEKDRAVYVRANPKPSVQSKDPESSVLEGLPTRVVEKKDTRKGNTKKSPEVANLGVVAIVKTNYSTCSNVHMHMSQASPTVAGARSSRWEGRGNASRMTGHNGQQ